ncbi:MAG TPA: iron ABC transporter permease [Alphaproteobacteria bacterium]|jgi:iron(III) transport system permease protein
MAELKSLSPGSPVRFPNFALPRRLRLSAFLCTLVLLGMAFFVLYPVALLVYSSFLVDLPSGGKALGLDTWISAWSQNGILQAVINTFQRVVVTELISFPVAVLIAWLVIRTDMPGKRLIENFFWVAFFLPALPVLMGWILLFDPGHGLVNLGWAWLFNVPKGPFNIYGFSGIVFAHIAARSVAAKFIFLAPAFRNLDGAMEEASRIAGAGPIATLRKIVIPVLMPAFLITIAISLIHSLESFEIELILGPTTNFYVFSTKIFQVVREDPPQFGVATVLGLAILISMLPLILWQQHLSHSRNFVTVTSRSTTLPLRLRKWRVPIFAVICTFGAFITVVPVACLLMGTFMNLYGYFDIEKVWTTTHWATVLTDNTLIQSTVNTLIMGLSAALIGTFWFALVAYISVRTKYAARGVLDLLSWLPASIPGIILGLALLWMFLTVPALQPFYGTTAILVVAAILASVSTGVQLIKSNMVQLGNELEEASFIAGGSWFYTFRRIVLPLVGPVLIAVALLTFASAARNVAGIAMLVSGDNRPLSMLQADYMIDGAFEPAAVVGVLIVILALTMSVVARYIGGRVGLTAVAKKKDL